VNAGDAIPQLSKALGELRQRANPGTQLDVVTELIATRLQRSRPDDIAAVHALVAKWRSVAAALGDPDRIAQLDHADAEARFYGGDDRGVRDTFVALWRPTGTAARRVVGIVRDSAGRRVADALVVGGEHIIGDSESAWFPIQGSAGDQRTVRTAADGTFTLDLVASDGSSLVAQRGEMRSRPVAAADRVELVVLPTRTLDGHVALGGIPSTRVRLRVLDPESAHDAGPRQRYLVTGSVSPDGSFHVAGVSRRQVIVNAYVMGDGTEAEVTSAPVPAGDGAARVEMEVRSGNRSVTVLVRSTLLSKLDAAQVFVLSGARAIQRYDQLLSAMNVGSVREITADQATELASVPADTLRPDDLVAHFEHLADDTYTVCAAGINGNVAEAYAQMWDHVSEVQLACKTFRSDAGVVVVAAPPQRRIE
jgi:hypothetical protein